MGGKEYENEEAAVDVDEELSQEEILEEYQRRQMIQHLTGPLISFFVHLIVIGLAAFFIVGEKTTEGTSIVIDSKKREHIDPIPPPKERDIPNLEDKVTSPDVPEHDPPDVPPEKVSEDQTDRWKEMATADDTSFPHPSRNVRETTSPRSLPAALSHRKGEKIKEAVEDDAVAGEATEKSVLLALEWLKETQNPDGSWAEKNKLPITGLGLLAFLGHGETPAESEEYGATVKKAIQYLTHYFRNNDVLNNEYKNGIIAYALAEAAALTGAPSVRGVAKRCVRKIIDGQQVGGGWCYNYEKGDFYAVSVSGWQMQALKAAHYAQLRLDGLVEAIESATGFMENHAFKNGGFPEVGAYSRPNRGRPRLKYTAMGTFALQFLGKRERESEALESSLDKLEEMTPEWPEGSAVDQCYKWYYINQCLFHGGTKYFYSWNRAFAPMLVANQEEEGYWDMPPDSMGELHFKHWYWTALNTLSLEVYYRYLPSYKSPERIVEDSEDLLNADEVRLKDISLKKGSAH